MFACLAGGCRRISYVATKGLRMDLLSGADKGVALVSLCRPEGRNSLSRDLVTSLEDVFSTMASDNSVRVVILRSDLPKVFCSGADLKERLLMSEDEVVSFVRRLRELMQRVEEVPVPVIAAIDGAALGGGLELSLACDIRIATTASRLGLVETKLAIIPGAGGTQRLSRLIGPTRAKELIFTGRILSGEDALNWGLVNHAVAGQGDPSYDKALEIAREILPNGPIGVRMAKLAIDRGYEVDSGTGNLIEELCYSRVVSTRDRIEGLKAFQEKRAPRYLGE